VKIACDSHDTRSSKLESKLNPNAREFAPRSKQEISIGSVRLTDSSLYVTGIVDGQSTPILLDTGAAVTLVSNKLWKTCNSYHPILEPADGSLQSATGESLKIVGVVNRRKFEDCWSS
jgi:hypothetical protein